MERTMSIDALVFDAYGTLFDVHSVIIRCEALWPGKGGVVSHLWRTKQLEYTWLRSLMGRYVDFETVTVDALRHACELFELECGEAHVAELMDAYRQLATFAEVQTVLPALAGRKRVILSNGSPGMLDAVVRHSGLDTQLDAVLSVDAIKRYKPDPRVYQLAVDALGIDANRIGFVSSNGWDIAGAASFGFETFWINRTGAPVDRLGIAPGHIMTTLADLPALLR
jgi:2-haloacid dehalogenase